MRGTAVGGGHCGAGARHAYRFAGPRRGVAVDDRDQGDDQRPRHRPDGFVFLLADTAFAYACNSYNRRCVAQHCSITYLKPASIGSRLTARAREVRRAERSGIYDVSVSDETGAPIAEFRGHSRTAPGSFF